MSGRIYTVEFENVAVAAAQDFFEINPSTQRPIELHALGIYNAGGTADAGDAQEEFLRTKVIRGHTTSGSGGSTQTPAPRKSVQLASTITAEVNNTTSASAGTPVDLASFGWNVRVGLEYVWTPETRPGTVNNNLIVVRLMAAPADSVTMSGFLLFEELS